jgi:hypothetical protein
MVSCSSNPPAPLKSGAGGIFFAHSARRRLLFLHRLINASAKNSLNRRGLPEAASFESRRQAASLDLRLVARFRHSRRNVSDRLQQSLVVEPIYHFERP